MAKLVAAVGTPHGPMLPKQVAGAPGQLRSEALVNQVRIQLEKAEYRPYDLFHQSIVKQRPLRTSHRDTFPDEVRRNLGYIRTLHDKPDHRYSV